MKKTAIIVDSGCAPTQEFMEKNELEFIGINIILDGKQYADGKQLKHEDFYASVKKIKNISTLPPSQADMIKKYQKLKSKGFERVVDIHMSSKLSGVFKNGKSAKGFIPGMDIHVIDTRSVSAGGYFVASKIIDLLKKGREMDEIEQMLPEIIRSTQVLLSTSTLKYLVKNGRIGKAQGMVGNLLRLKPVLKIEDGMVTPFSKEKGMDNAVKAMADAAFDFVAERQHNVKIYKDYGLDNNKKYMDQAFDRFMDKFTRLPIKDYEVISGRGWPTVTCHSGPEVFALSVYGEKTPI